MILAEGAFKKENSRFQSQSSPFCSTIYILSRGQILDCEIYILKDVFHDHGTWIASAIKGLVVGIDRLVHPCDITVSLDLLEIEICAKKSCQSLISFPDLIIFTLMRMGKEEVYLPEHVPVPCTCRSRHDSGSLHLV